MALYDPNEFPETETVADFTLEDVLAWARTKPADEEYDFTEAGRCAVAQFGLATGRPHLVDLCSNALDRHCLGLGDAAAYRDWTFGAFAKRLESALA